MIQFPAKYFILEKWSELSKVTWGVKSESRSHIQIVCITLILRDVHAFCNTGTLYRVLVAHGYKPQAKSTSPFSIH